MATLQALAISGIRSYNPEKLERIDFTHPLTLINGKNGSGKTTIIECLKYITTGVLPPSVNRQNCFVMDPSIAGTAEVKGDIRLRFRTAKNRVVIAKKVFMVSKTQKKLSSKAVEQSLKTKDDDGKQIEVSQRCADIEKQIPQMLGISKPILNNIVFCHQDDSLWPFSQNNVLKNIFDELFDTKRFTKALQNMKEAIKEYEKQKLELKGQIDYLKAGFYKIVENRTQTLLGLVQVVQASKELRQVQLELEPVRSKIRQLASKQSAKNDLIGKKGVFEYKIADVKEKIQKIQNKAEQQSVRLKKISIEQGKIVLEKYKTEIAEIEEEIKLLQSALQQIRDKQTTNKKKAQFYMEAKRLKQILPEIGEVHLLTPKSVLDKLAQTLKLMRRREKSLREEKEKYHKIMMPSIPIHEEKGEDKLDLLKLDRKKADLENLASKIRALYAKLYSRDANEKEIIGATTESSKRAGEKLSKLQAQLELKKTELRKYQSMKPPQSKNLQQQIYEIRYRGIQFHEYIQDYTRMKKQCGICMKGLSNQEIEGIRMRAEKMRVKTQNTIAELQAHYSPQNVVDPGPIIAEIEAFIAANSKIIKSLEEEKQRYDKSIEIQQQISLNKELTRLLSAIQLKPTPAATIQVAIGECTIEKFRQLCNQYRMVSMECANLGIQVARSKQRSQRIQELKKQYATQLSSKLAAQSSIEKLQAQTKDLSMIENIFRKISDLHQSIERNEEKSSYSEQSPAQLTNKLSQLSAELLDLRNEFKNMQLNIEYSGLEEEEQRLGEQMAVVVEELRSISNMKTQNSELENRRNSLQVEEAKLSQKIRLKKSLHSRYLEEESTYLGKVLRYNSLCSMIGDIQSTMKAMERATNRLHNEKMDQINKILFDIWQEVYHAKDIEFIRINSVSEKKNSGFGYSIMMQKNKQLIEMKGRCSMGQKVLASLIIRMALAQAFSASTHILTLDEPTTNLDRIHIEKLADSISSIIQMEQNSRLQLIIISHDMEFISLLKKHTNYYFEICRNDKNFSTIKRREIAELNEDVLLPRLEAVHY